MAREKRAMPSTNSDYWNYREEISLHNGILFKSQKAIVPKAMRPEMLLRIHSSHQGIASCPRKAKDMVSWPGMNSEIKAIVERCSVSAEFPAKNACQPMKSHEVPDRPWSKSVYRKGQELHHTRWLLLRFCWSRWTWGHYFTCSS